MSQDRFPRVGRANASLAFVALAFSSGSSRAAQEIQTFAGSSAASESRRTSTTPLSRSRIERRPGQRRMPDRSCVPMPFSSPSSSGHYSAQEITCHLEARDVAARQKQLGTTQATSGGGGPIIFAAHRYPALDPTSSSAHSPAG
jgi:hypothetical protein